MTPARPSATAIAALTRCCTPAAIVRAMTAFYAANGTPSRALRRALHLACQQRTYELAKTRKNGHLLAVRLDAGAGNSRRWSVAGEVYRTGTWGNGPGHRWAMEGFRVWYMAKLKAAGIRGEDRRRNIAEWVTSGYPWFALEMLSGRKRIA